MPARTADECGSSAAHCLARARVKKGLNAGIAGNGAARKKNQLMLTTTAAGPYKLAHTARRPLTARLRASEAPHLWWDRASEEVVGGSSFVGFLARRGVETARFPGCLTGESEERETWTAESLRTASSNGEGFGFFWERGGHGRDFGGQRFKVHRAGHLRLRVQSVGVVDLVKTCDLPESISSNLRV